MKLSKKKKEQMVEEAYRLSCSGIQISIMDISKVFAVGLAAVEQGKQGVELQQVIRAFVETIRKN